MTIGLAVVILGAGVFLVVKKGDAPPAHPESVICTMDAKICPDGTGVGRTGPNCEFADCPSVETVKSATTAVLNQKILNSAVYITPLEVVGDSRCPADVACIWAGTVTLKANLEIRGTVEIAVLTLGSPVTFAGKRVTLIGVTPGTHSGKTILPRDYRFEFSVTESATTIKGILEGTMTIGPICPVERIDHPCLPTPEMFAMRKIAVYKSDKKTLVTTITPDGNGKFSMPLSVGSYYVSMVSLQSGGPGGVSGLPTIITIKQGATIHLEISIDTGIR